MPPIACSATASLCVKASGSAGSCLSSRRLPRFASPNGPRTGSCAAPGRAYHSPSALPEKRDGPTPTPADRARAGGLRRAPSPGGSGRARARGQAAPGSARARAAGRAGAFTHRRTAAPARARARHARAARGARRRGPPRRRQRGRRSGARGARRSAARGRRGRRVAHADTGQLGHRRRHLHRSQARPVLPRLLPGQRPRAHGRLAHAPAALRGDDPRAAAGAGPSRRPGLPRADRERLLQFGHQSRQGRRHVAVHEAHGPGVWVAGGFVGGRAPRSLPRYPGRGPPPQEPQRPVRLAVPRRRGLQRRRGEGVTRRAPAPGRRGGRLAQLRRDVLPAVRHQVPPPRDQGLRPQADRRGAHREGARALRLHDRVRRAPRPTTRSSCRR